ncbi:MAG: EndoU domain-containing protein [Caldilineaceae bacterium]
MYNMTVADAHTYAVGDGQWVVHNSCSVFVDGVNLSHIFEGEINKIGRAVGFHFAGGTWYVGKARIDAITAVADANGVFRAKVSVFDHSTGNWVAKRAESTFFPNAWNEQQVVDEILSSFINGQVSILGKPRNYWEGISSSGIRIGGYLNFFGDINTAFPIP